MIANILYLLLFIISILATILFVIGTHEFAHFIVARLLGVRVLRFSIGFGRTLWRRLDKSGTEYVFALIPLGGYVKMLDENEGKVPPAELHRAFNRQPFYKKFLIVLAGPVMNLLCAAVLYWIIFVIGFVTIKPIIGQVTPDSIASQAGLKANQEIVSVDHEPIRSWTGVMFRLLAHLGDNNQLTIGARTETNQLSQHTLDMRDWKLDGLTPDPLSSLGIKPYEPPMPLIIGYIGKDSPAAHSALKIGDTLIALNDQKINDWQQVMQILKASPDKQMLITIKRGKKTMTLKVTVGSQRDLLFMKTGYLGISPEVEIPPHMLQQIKYAPMAAISPAFREVKELTYFNLVLFGKLITGKLSLQTLGGPITIFENAGKSLNLGIVPFLSFLAFMSTSVGIINLFPVPGLDGGHLLFELIEAVIRRPLPTQLLVGLYYAGFGLLIFVLVQALINDLLRLA